MVDPPATRAVGEPDRGESWGPLQILRLVIIILVGAGLRLWALDGPSLWYDEVVTMRVARTTGPAALVGLLDQIDGTRAPLHPLVLQIWLRFFGSSDLAGRSFSALCGLGAVGVIYLLGRVAFGEMTGRWAAWLAAVCPPLVYYSREARMYAWLVLLSCASWLVFLSFRSSARPWKWLVYWLLLTSLVYSHPLGLFMVAAHGLAFLLVRSYLKLTTRRWLALQGALLMSIIPWLPRYIDHGTDYPMPRHPIRFLLAVPIEYVGGNSVVLGICLAIVVFGLMQRWPRPAISYPAENLTFLCWATVPPLFMYCYSYLSQPIFGPPRYHLYIAPAYLILLAHGLSRLPTAIRWPLVALGFILSLLLLQNYQPALKADWRGLAAWIEAQDRNAGAGDSQGKLSTIVVHPSDARFPREQVEAARYCLSPRSRVIPASEQFVDANKAPPEPIYDVYCLARSSTPANAESDEQQFYGLRVKRRKPASP